MSKQSNTDIAMLAISRTAKAAKQSADAAKQAAEEAKNVAVTLDEESSLNVNGRDTGIKVITATGVAKAVGEAFSGPEAAAKIAEEQAEFVKQQAESNIQVALEKGVYYIEDGLTSDLRGKALSGWWKDNKQTPEEAARVSAQIQTFINSRPSGAVIKARHGSVFSVDKNIGALPEKFGADGRRVTVGGMTLTIDGAQPCIYIDKDTGDGRVYDFRGVMFIVEFMGVNAFEITGDNNVILHGGIIRTRALLEFGYVRGADRDKMLFAPIDGWTKERPDIGFGYADKGLWELGFNTTTLKHDLARYRNNAAQVHEVRQPDGMNKARCAELTRQGSSRKYESVGGYWDENGESAFPQDDGTTSPMWGKWRGGQRGSRGNGITLYNCRNTIIFDFDIEGFDGSAVQAGLYGTQDCQDVQGGDSATAEAKGMIAYDTLICGGWFDKMYTGGIGAVRVVGFTVTGLQCQGNQVGHPDWSVEHSRDGKMVTLDPGYMLWTSRYMPMIGVVFMWNNFGTAARKVIDAHTGNDIVIIGNSGKAGYYGISVVLEETFATQGNAATPAEESSFYYQEANMTIANNNVMGGVYGIHLNNGATGVKARKDRSLWWLRGNIKVRDNIVKAPYVGVAYNYGHYGFDISGNSVTFAKQLGEPYGQRRLNTVNVTNGGSGYSEQTYLTITGGGAMARDGYAEPTIKNGVITGAVVRKTGTRYEDAASIVVTAVDPTGSGSGATFTATVSETSTAYMIGAETKYGTMQVNFTGNRAANSPDGNFSRLLVSASCTGSTFRDNFFNETPYTKGTDAAKPYVSTKEDVYRSGQPSQLLAQTVEHIDSFHENNKAMNELTGKVTELSFRNKHVSTKAPATPLTAVEIEKLVNDKVAVALSKVAETRTDAESPPADPPPADDRSDAPDTGQDTSSQPVAEVPPAPKQPRAFGFSFAGAEGERIASTDGSLTLTQAGTVRMTDTSSLIHADDKTIEARLATPTAVTGRWWELMGVNSSADEPTTLIVPMRVDALTVRNASFMFSAETATGLEVPGLHGTVIVNKHAEAGKFTFVANPRVRVNGEPVDPAKTYNVGEWLVVSATWQAEVGNVALLGRYDGNPVLGGRIGEELTLIKGADHASDVVTAKIAELKQLKGIA